MLSTKTRLKNILFVGELILLCNLSKVMHIFQMHFDLFQSFKSNLGFCHYHTSFCHFVILKALIHNFMQLHFDLVWEEYAKNAN